MKWRGTLGCGRHKTEWMKVYGILTGHEKAAEEAFKIQEEKVKMLEKDRTDTEKKVAFFFINSKGNVVTYKSDTYVPAMIAIAGGSWKESGLES